MSRRIIAEQLQAGGTGSDVDGYKDRLLKYIPADVVGAWIAVTRLLSGVVGVPTAEILWVAFFLGIVATAAWTWNETKLPDKPPLIVQTVISTGAFAVWVFALGGPFATLASYHPVYG